MVYHIEAEEIADGWKKIVKKIMEEGNLIEDERGSLTRELLNVIVKIQKPIGRGFHFNDPIYTIKIPEDYFWSGEKLKKYAEQFLSKKNRGFVYTYGNRLREHFQIDQVKEAIKRLKNFRGTRRATMTTWDPQLDYRNDEIPCMILIDFKIRDNNLHTTGVWRSHDIYGAWFPNAVGLSFLANYIADRVDANVGPLTIHSISAHIYEINFNKAKKVR